MDTGLLILRVVVGALMFGHGTQKLFGWWGGGGLNGTASFMESLRFRNGRTAAVAAGLTETFSGFLLTIGFLTPFGAAGLVGAMVTAIVTVHLPRGLWNTNGGVELPLVYATVAVALAFVGPGRYAIDALFDFDLSGASWGVTATVAGLVASMIALAPPARVSSHNATHARGVAG